MSLSKFSTPKRKKPSIWRLLRALLIALDRRDRITDFGVEYNQQEIRKIVQDYKKGKVVLSEIESIDTLMGVFKYFLEYEVYLIPKDSIEDLLARMQGKDTKFHVQVVVGKLEPRNRRILERYFHLLCKIASPAKTGSTLAKKVVPSMFRAKLKSEIIETVTIARLVFVVQWMMDNMEQWTSDPCMISLVYYEHDTYSAAEYQYMMSNANNNVFADKQNESGCTFLHVACAKGDFELAKVLADCININSVSRNAGATPLFYACASGNVKLVRFLIEKGADVNGGTNWKPIHIAVYSEFYKITKMLLKHKADVNARCPKLLGYTPLHILLSSASVPKKFVKLLLKQANVKAKAANGYTPLHVAACWDRKDLVKMLVKAGSEMHATNSKGNTPLHIASLQEHHDVANYLASKMMKTIPSMRNKCLNTIVMTLPSAPICA